MRNGAPYTVPDGPPNKPRAIAADAKSGAQTTPQ
jgi:hypothetical protein